MRGNTLQALAIFLLSLSTLALGACNDKEPEADLTAGRPVMRVLFVGNEHTLLHHMPYMLQLLAENDPTASFKVEIGVHAAPKASLAQLWNNPNTKVVMHEKKWDYVVIQPQHLWASSEGSVFLTRKAISVWSNAILAIGAQPVIMTTWAPHVTHSIYGTPKYLNLKNPKNMNRITRGYTKAIAEKYGLLVVPVGDYWTYATTEVPDIALHDVDGSSPTLHGAYLTALVLYKTLVDKSIHDSSYDGGGIQQETRDKIISIVSKNFK